MKVYYEWGIQQLNKKNEELCGDSVGVSRSPDSVMLALSDGLGSGVKANILSTLTTRIAMNMLENDLPVGEVVQALSETLPVCKVRKLAYSTFAIAEFCTKGKARIVEFDSPGAIFIRDNELLPVDYTERDIDGKNIQESNLKLKIGDWLIFVSDGVLNAGIGGVYPLGWGWEQTADFCRKNIKQGMSAQKVAEKVVEAVSELYAGSPGDDVSVVVIKARHKKIATVLTGPPRDKKDDKEVTENFLNEQGRLIVCGGTTAKMISRLSKKSLEVDLDSMTEDVPPEATMEGIDLVTEGILTLTRVSEFLQSGISKQDVRFKRNGAADLLRELLSVDYVTFIVGEAVNPAHQNPELPRQLEIRLSVVKEIAHGLRNRGIEVEIKSV